MHRIREDYVTLSQARPLHSRVRSESLMAIVLAGAALLAACGGSTPQATQGASPDAVILAAEKTFLDAAHKGDGPALGNMLDADFVWISADGKTFNRAEVTKVVPKTALADEAGSDFSRFTYSDVVHTVTVNNGKLHVLRVWAKRPDGWRTLVYQEVRSLDAAPAVTPEPDPNCDNPCKNIPFTPQNDVQRAVAKSYTELESAAVAHDTPVWSLHSAYEFLA